LRAEREVTVSNAHGLHARPAMMLVERAAGFESEIVLVRPRGDADAGVEDGAEADAKSVMQVVTLAAAHGTPLLVRAEGPDAEAAAEAVAALFEERFGGID